jgi:hypothetical protein
MQLTRSAEPDTSYWGAESARAVLSSLEESVEVSHAPDCRTIRRPLAGSGFQDAGTRMKDRKRTAGADFEQLVDAFGQGETLLGREPRGVETLLDGGAISCADRWKCQ